MKTMCPIFNPRNDFNPTIDALGVYFIKTKKNLSSSYFSTYIFKNKHSCISLNQYGEIQKPSVARKWYFYINIG